MSKSRFSTEGLERPQPKPTAADAAGANYSQEWNAILAKVDLTAVVVQTDRSPLAFKSVNLFEKLGEEMEHNHLGQYDSTEFQPHLRHFFYAKTSDLACALEFLKTSMAAAGLLEISAIGHYDATGNAWREFWPALRSK